MAEGNGNRELGEIQATLKHIQGDIREIKGDIRDFRGNLSVHCNETTKLSERVDDNYRELGNLRKKSEKWDIANSIGASMSAIVAGVITWLKT